MAVAPAFGMILVVVMAIILPAIVLLVVGLSNRHTRGATKGVAIAIGVVIGLFFLWRMAAVPSFNHTANVGQERAFFEEQIATFDRMAEDLERSVDNDANRQMADQYRRQAHEFRTHLSHMPAGTPQAHFPNVPSWVAVSPVMLLVFMVIVFLVFKHAGPTMGFAALAIPFVLLFVGYSSLHVREDERTLAQTRLDMIGDQITQQHGNDVETIVLSPVEESRAHGEIPMDVEPSEPSQDLESRGDESLDAPPVSPEVPLPDWVKQPPKSVPNVYRRVVASSWYPSDEECRTKIDPKIEQAVSNYLHQKVGDQGMGLVHSLPQLGITSDFIRDNLVSDEFYQRRGFAHEDGLTNLHVLLEIDSADSDFMVAQWRAHARMHRIAWVRNLMVGVMLSLAGVLGLIKIDTATKGYYTKRLFIGVPAAIIGGVMLIVATAEWWDRYF